MYPLLAKLVTISDSLCNFLTIEQLSFFLTQFLRSYFTKIVLENKAYQDLNTFSILSDFDEFIPIFISKISDYKQPVVSYFICLELNLIKSATCEKKSVYTQLVPFEC